MKSPRIKGFPVSIPPKYSERIATALRELLAEGQTLEDSLRELHGVRKIGLISLVEAVVSECGLPKAEAQKVVVRSTFDLRQP